MFSTSCVSRLFLSRNPIRRSKLTKTLNASTDNVEFPQARPDLESAFKDQLLVSANVYSCDTLVLFMHDLGALKADVHAATLDLNVEKTQLVNTSHQVLQWAMVENKFGIIDMNFLAHQRTARPSNVSWAGAWEV
jgi:hypothetical protein